MDKKSIQTLEFQAVLNKLEGYAAFSASQKLARNLRPSHNFNLARERIQRTTEARLLLSEYAEVGIGGAHDIRPQVKLASREGVLEIHDFISIKSTLESTRYLGRFFQKHQEDFPELAKVCLPLIPPEGLIEAISKVISEEGEIKDSASPKLSSIRSQLRNTNNKLQRKLDQIITNPDNQRFLQELIITQRNGRYVIPLRAEHRGRFKSVVQDTSASGSTLFVEPLAVVELNNAVIELQVAERDEIRAILFALSQKVKESADQLNQIVTALAVFDLGLMCAKYAVELQAVEPILYHPDEVLDDPQKPILKLIKVRHPLIEKDKVVPIDILLEDHVFSLVITGPNTGGKTVTLKTAGLMVLMAQSGMHIPAVSGSEQMLFRDIFADIGDEQSIEQSLSTFSGHVTNIVRILKKARKNTLVLLDELGAGTDPQEGSALARSILQHLIQKRIPCLVATHYPELKAFAHANPGVMNASMEFDLKTLEPTYHLILGLPGRSNALAIASRLGMHSEVIENARTMLNPDDLKTDDLLDEIREEREKAKQNREAAELEQEEIQAIRQEWQTKMDEIDAERQEIIRTTHEEMLEEVERVRQELASLRKSTKKDNGTTSRKKLVRKQLDSLEDALRQPVEKQVSDTHKLRPLKIGDRVHIRSLNVEGNVHAIHLDSVEVEVGKMHMKVSVADIDRSKNKEKKVAVSRDEVSSTKLNITSPTSPGIECHLRGLRVEDAIIKLEQYLEKAYTAGLPYVRIVHGKGTGIMRQVAREHLGRSQYVDHWEPAMQNEGGMGVTIAFMKKT